MMKQLQALTRWLLACLALASLLLLGMAVRHLMHAPYVGAGWAWHTGVVDIVYHEEPASNQLQLGDRIHSINGMPVLEARQIFPQQTGEIVQFEVERDHTLHTVTLRATEPPPEVVWRDMLPLLIALAFWVLGLMVLIFAVNGPQAWLAFLFAQAMSATLSAGSMTSNGPIWTMQLFDVLVWCFGPLAILFHLHFPAWISSRLLHYLAVAALGIALLASLPQLFIDPLALRSQYPSLPSIRLLWLSICLLAVVLILVRTYHTTSLPQVRQRVGLVAVGGSLAFLPFLTLSLLPDVVLGWPLLQYELVFLFLLLVPLSYGYAMFKYRLLPLDRYVSRGAATLLLGVGLGAIYVIVYAALRLLLPTALWEQSLAIAITAVLVGMTIIPLYRRIEIRLNRFLYGGWYDYRSAIQHLSQTLHRQIDDQDTAQTLCRSIQIAMQLQGACLLLAGEDGALHAVSVVGEAPVDDGARLAAESALVTFFRDQPQIMDRATLRTLLAGAILTASEQQLLRWEQGKLWVPLAHGGRLWGLLILMPRRGSDSFSRTDRDILEVVASQATSALQNARLATELRQRATDIEGLHRQLLRAREAERTTVAHDLHDEVLQELVALNFGITRACQQLGAEDDERVLGVQDHVQRIMRDVRRLCADLRPPTLDTLGLAGAIRDRLHGVRRTASFEVRLVVDGDEHQPVPDDVALCLFRFVQEALNNIEKHAEAEHVVVHLSLEAEAVSLTVIDDGQGFEAPSQLHQLIEEQHYGLVGLHERLELVNGTFEIASTPGQGTRLHASVPLAPATGTLHEKGIYHGTLDRPVG
jgi:signal transduction histidine kinase